MNLELSRELYGLKRLSIRPLVTHTAFVVKGAHPCQACASTVVHRDLPKGWTERLLLPLLGLRAYRCVDCGHRFFDRPRSARVALKFRKGASPRLPEMARS